MWKYFCWACDVPAYLLNSTNKLKLKQSKSNTVNESSDDNTKKIPDIEEGMDKSDMTITKRAEIEKRLKKMAGRIKTISLKLIPKIRQKEIARRKQMASK